MQPAVDRLPHADIEDIDRRQKKARKIVALLEPRASLSGARLLEIGTGSGAMAAHFASVVGHGGEVHAVDRVDIRRVRDGYGFSKVEGVELPFADDHFDVVISNHVMEHVGDKTDQAHHLDEIARVLKPRAVCYLSVPNRWRVIEPHFRLPLLSWLPQRYASAYVRITRRGQWYDVVPPSHNDMARLFAGSSLSWDDVTVESMRVMADVEGPPALVGRLLRGPAWLLRLGLPIVPSMIYIGRKA